MVEVSVSGAIGSILSDRISHALLGCPHDLSAVRSRFSALEPLWMAEEIDPDVFVNALF